MVRQANMMSAAIMQCGGRRQHKDVTTISMRTNQSVALWKTLAFKKESVLYSVVAT
jgi:hypothetical protein